MTTDTLRPKEVAQTLDVSGQTLRRWAKRFSDYLSEGAQSGRKRRFYTSRDVAILRQAGAGIAQGLNTIEIRAQLDNLEQPTDTEANQLIIIPELARELQDTRASNQQLLTMLKEYVERVDALELRDAEQSKLIVNLAAVDEAQRVELEAAQKEVERLATNDAEERDALRKLILWRRAWERRPWWARILGLEPPQVDGE